MTVVIVKRQDQKVLILADTMIGDDNATAQDVMPGRLKAVTIAPRFTVGFAGLADPAFCAIRDAGRACRTTGLTAAMQIIRESSLSGETDYLVISHYPDAAVNLVRRGTIVEVPDLCAIGNYELFKKIIERERDAEPDPDLFRGRLRHRFMDDLLTQKHITAGVGGFPIAIAAEPEGHRYLTMSGGYTYKVNIVWGQTTEQPWEQVESGDGHFQLSILPSARSDVPVIGACLSQARMGYVFSGFEQERPFQISLFPRNQNWEGKEGEMFAVLREAVEEHVAKFDRQVLEENAGTSPQSWSPS